MAKRGRLWMPVDVGFYRDEKVLAAGWSAAELYLAALGYLSVSGSKDGVLSRDAARKLGVERWDRKADRLVKAGLWLELDPDRYQVVAWMDWRLESDSAARTREWRRRQREGETSQGDVT